MTVTADERLLGVELAHNHVTQVENPRPRGEAADHAYSDHEVAVANGVTRYWVDDGTFFSILAVAQLAWISGLAYGVYLLA